MCGSAVEQALRERIEARGGTVPTAGAASMLQKLYFLEHLRDARAASGILSAGECASVAIDVHGRLHVWGTLEAEDEELFRSLVPSVLSTMQDTRFERVSVGDNHILALTHEGEVLSFGSGWRGHLRHGDGADQDVPKVIEALRALRR